MTKRKRRPGHGLTVATNLPEFRMGDTLPCCGCKLHLGPETSDCGCRCHETTRAFADPVWPARP